ncbi:MAG: hypothetical protein HFH82_03730 [Lachnospiraceae bacterium]|nr:hypothetical protein [Lachnospiraceae bacterium]
MALVAAKCTQCGANIEIDDTKEAGICKYCGTAFITEKAINNYNINNTVNIQSGGNTINITSADKSNDYLVLARKSKNNVDVEKAEKFYTLVLEGQPNNWEANFYSTYYSVMQTKTCDIPGKAIQMRNSLGVSVELLKNSLPDEEAIIYIKEMQEKLYELSTSLFNSYRSYFQKFRRQTTVCQSYNYAVFAIAGILYNFGDQLLEQYPQNNAVKEIVVSSWKHALSFRKVFSYDFTIFCNSGIGDTRASVQQEIDKYASKIREYDSSYEAPVVRGYCYIATCIYGSYDCPQVWTLRRFRDYTLNTTWYGRLFIKCYYAISPTLVKWFGRTKWFRQFWKSRLDKMVSELNNNGVCNTYYDD